MITAKFPVWAVKLTHAIIGGAITAVATVLTDVQATHTVLSLHTLWHAAMVSAIIRGLGYLGPLFDA